jgi:hypothetical protein
MGKSDAFGLPSKHGNFSKKRWKLSSKDGNLSSGRTNEHVRLGVDTTIH